MGQWKKSRSTGSCPVTGGVPTRMTADGFDRLCNVKRAEMRSEDSNHAHIEVRGLINKLNICSTCLGKKWPVELEIITIEGTMATKRGLCEACDQKGVQVSMNYGVNMCSTCKTDHSKVKNRPESIVGAIKRIGMVDRYVGDLAAEGVTATVDSQVMERIAAVVGYDGTDGEGLIAAVEAMAAELKSPCWPGKCIAMDSIAAAVGYGGGSPDELIEAVEAMASSRRGFIEDREEYRCRMRGVAEILGLDYDTLMDAPSLAEEVRALSENYQQVTEWNEKDKGTIAALKNELAKARNEINITDHLYPVIDKIRMVLGESEAPSSEDILQMALEALQYDEEATIPSPDVIRALGLPEGPTSWQTIELAAMQTAAMMEDDKRFAAKLSQRVLESFEVVEEPAVTECIPVFAEAPKPNGKAIEAYILDLALMALRGEVTGLDPEFLGAMREAV